MPKAAYGAPWTLVLNERHTDRSFYFLSNLFASVTSWSLQHLIFSADRHELKFTPNWFPIWAGSVNLQQHDDKSIDHHSYLLFSHTPVLLRSVVLGLHGKKTCGQRHLNSGPLSFASRPATRPRVSPAQAPPPERPEAADSICCRSTSMRPWSNNSHPRPVGSSPSSFVSVVIVGHRNQEDHGHQHLRSTSSWLLRDILATILPVLLSCRARRRRRW
jgi:hypothetical protein